MTRKHYILIAAALHNYFLFLKGYDVDASVTDNFDTLVYSLADMMEADNPCFDRTKFIQAVFHGKQPIDTQ